MKQITIIWLAGPHWSLVEVGRTNTGDEDTPENRADLEQYINDTTEGLDAPEDWSEYDLIGEEVA